MPNDHPIGILDSGLGGLSVLQQVRALLPYEDVLYFADTAHLPYGDRDSSDIQRLAASATAFLLARGAKMIVIACNTASVAALSHLRRCFAIPFVGVVPAIKPAALNSDARRVGVMATDTTLAAQVFAELESKFAANVLVVKQACPGLVDLVEAGQTDSRETELLLTRYLAPLLAVSVDTIVLGCTHYVFLRPLLQHIVGSTVTLVDSGEAVARQVARILAERGLVAARANAGETVIFTSGDAGRVSRIAAQLLGQSPPTVHALRHSPYH